VASTAGSYGLRRGHSVTVDPPTVGAGPAGARRVKTALTVARRLAGAGGVCSALPGSTVAGWAAIPEPESPRRRRISETHDG